MADLDTSSQQFNEIEKRNAAFKFVFGILQLDSFKKISQEKMSTGFQVFSSEILGGNVKSALNTNNINQARIRTWVTESGNYTGEGAIWSGSFSSSNESTTDNPNVEKIVLPLLKIQSTHNQSYVAYLNSGSTYEDISFNSTFNSHDITVGAKLILSSSNRVTDFISPFKFGSAYNVSLNPSNNTYTGPNTDIEIGQDTSQETTNKSYGGWVFDYKNGTLYVAVDPSGDEPLISDFKHPLWLTGYRYIGSTGSIATATTSSHAVSALSSSHAVTASFALNAGGGVGVGFPFSGSAVITGSLIVSGGTSYSFGGFLISESVNNSGNVDTELRRTIPVTGQNGTGSLIFSSVGQDGNIVPLLQFEDKGGTILGSTRGGLKIESQGGVGGVGSAVIRNSIDHHNLELKHVGSGSLILRASGDNANLVFSNGSVSGESQGLNIISGSLTGFSSTDVTIRNSVVHPMPLLYKFGHSANNAELIMFKAGGVASTTIRTSGTSEFDGDISATGTLTLGTTTFTETDLASVVASSDNLGHHTASLDLNMSNNDIVNVKSIKVNNIEASASNTITIADNLSPAGNIISTGISSTLSYRFGVFTDSLDVGTEGGTPRLLRVHGRISASAVTSSEINIGGATFTSASLASGGGGGVSNYSDLSGIPSGIFSSSLQPFTNITASGNISASGDLFVNDITMDGTAGDPSQLIGKKAGTERFRIETKGGGSNSALMWLDDGSGNRGIYLDGSDNPNFIKGNLQLGKNFDYPFTPPEKLTVEGNISASGNVSANTITAGKYITLKPSSNSGKVHITGSLTVSGSSTFTNLGTFVNTGSILNLGDTTTQGTFTSAGKTILKAGVGTPDGRLNGTLVVNAKIHESDFRTNIAEFGINGTPQYAFQRVRNGGIFPVNTNIPTGMGNVHFPYRPDNSGNILTDVAGKPVPDGGFNIFNAVAGSPLTSSAHMVFWNVYSSSAGVVSESIGVIGYGGNSPVFGFGTTEPSASFHITASLTGSQTDLIRVQNDIGVPVFKMKPDGRFIMRNSGSSVNEVTMSVDSANNFVVNDTFKVNHKDVIFKSGSQEVSAKVDPSTGQINFEAPDGSKVGFKGNETTRTTSDGKVVKKVVQDGKEFTRSGSATENQIEFQQNPNGAFITVSGSTPGFNVIKSGTTNEFQIIRQTYNTMYAGGEVYTYGMDSTDKMWFINNSILAAASDSSLFRMSSSGDLFIKRNIELDGGINGISGSTIFTPNQINMITGVSGSGGTISAHHITASGNISASHSSGTTPTHFIGGHVQIGDGVRGNLHIKGGGQKAGIYRDTERRIEMINGGPNNFYGSSGENSFYCTDTSVVSGQDYISLKFYNDDSNVLNSAIYIQATQDHNEESAAGSKFLFNAFSNTDDPTEDLNHNSSQTYNLLTIDPNATAGTLNVKGDISSSGAINTLSHITASGNISSSGTIIGSNISGTNTGDQSLVHLAVTASDVTFNNITASGDIKLADGKKLIVDNGDFIQWSDANKFAIGGLKLADDYGQLTFNAGNASNYVMQLWNSGSYEAVGIGGNFSTPPPSTLTVEGSISGSGNLDVDGNVSVDGVLTATRKSFLIPHPTDEGKQLQYASLEGPENGVYIRGKLKGDDIIELPHYWTELIDKDSITVSLTPIGNFQYLYVRDISTKQIMVGINDKPTRRIYCHYVVYAERKDIDKLEVEI